MGGERSETKKLLADAAKAARKLRGAKEFWSWPPEWKMPAIPLVLGSEET